MYLPYLKRKNNFFNSQSAEKEIVKYTNILVDIKLLLSLGMEIKCFVFYLKPATQNINITCYFIGCM